MRHDSEWRYKPDSKTVRVSTNIKWNMKQKRRYDRKLQRRSATKYMKTTCNSIGFHEAEAETAGGKMQQRSRSFDESGKVRRLAIDYWYSRSVNYNRNEQAEQRNESVASVRTVRLARQVLVADDGGWQRHGLATERN